MADREKVIKELEEITKSEWMYKRADYYQMVCKDALALLKEQQSAYERGKRDGISQYLRDREEDEEYEY